MIGVKTDSGYNHSTGIKHNSMIKNVVGEKNALLMKPNSGHNFANSGNATTDIFNTSNSMLSWNEPLVGTQNKTSKGF